MSEPTNTTPKWTLYKYPPQMRRKDAMQAGFRALTIHHILPHEEWVLRGNIESLKRGEKYAGDIEICLVDVGLGLEIWRKF